MIRTNLPALNGQNKLHASRTQLATALERLSSGVRINGAGDDAAGQAIGNRMQAQINGQNQAARNASDGISLSQTAQGALGEINQRLQRIRELSVQGLNELYNGEMGDKIQAEINLNFKEIDRLNGTATFNGIPLLDGRGGTRQLQVGANDRETLNVNLNPPGFSVRELGLQDLTIQGVPDRITLRDTLSGSASRIPLDDAARTTLNYVPPNGDPNLVRVGGVDLVQLQSEGGRLREESVSAQHDTDTRLNTVSINVRNPVVGTSAGEWIAARQYMDSNGDPLSLSGAAIVSSGGKYWIEHNHNGSKHYYEAALSFESTGNRMTAQAVSATRVARADMPGVVGQPLTYAPQIAKSTADYSLTLDGNDESGTAGLELVYLRGEYYVEELTGSGQYAYYKADVRIGTDGAGPATNTISVVADRSNTIGAIVDQPYVSGQTTSHLKPGNANVQVNYVDSQGQVFSDVMGPDDDTGYVFNLNEFVNGGGAYKTATVVTNQKGEYLLQTVNGPAEVLLYYPLSYSVSTNVENNLTTITLRENGEAKRLRNPPLPLEAIDAALAWVDAKRSELGALDNRLAAVIEGNLTTRNNLDAARSRILDTDYAREIAVLTRAQILQQAGTSVLAQANQIPQGVLSLLRS